MDDYDTRGRGWVALAGVMILLVGLINTILGIAAIDKRVLPLGGLLASRVGRVCVRSRTG